MYIGNTDKYIQTYDAASARMVEEKLQDRTKKLSLSFFSFYFILFFDSC